MSETSTTDSRLIAFADVDEANAHVGLALAEGHLPEDVVAVLTHVQNDLFDVGADFCAPVVPHPEHPPLRIEQDYVDRLENGATTATLTCRRCGRSSSVAGRRAPPPSTSRAPSYAGPSGRRGRRGRPRGVGERARPDYLNRLSELLFILARYANAGTGDVLWVPGGERGR